MAGSRRTVSGDRREDTDQYLGDRFQGDCSGERNFCMTDENGNDVAYANSLWVYMDIERGRPARPDESEIAHMEPESHMR